MEDKSMPPSYPGFDSQPQYPNQLPPQQYPYNLQQGGVQQQQQGYPQIYPQPGFAQQPTPVIVQTGGSMPVIIGGGCPSCRVGVLTDDYGCCAIFLAIFFFPIGVLCCLAMRERVCTNCRARF